MISAQLPLDCKEGKKELLPCKLKRLKNVCQSFKDLAL
jgi:hypothetical protein